MVTMQPELDVHDALLVQVPVGPPAGVLKSSVSHSLIWKYADNQSQFISLSFAYM